MSNTLTMITTAAAQSLGQPIPDNWSTLDRSAKLAWLAENKSAQYRFFEPDALLEDIESRATSLQQSMQEAFTVLSGGLGTKDSADWLDVAGLI